jgi:GNAT superfamily N-acetyltransferase
MSTKRPKAASTVISQLTTANDPMPKIRDMRFALLADYPDAIPQIASWYFDEWGYLHPDSGLKDMQSKLQGSLNHDELPLLILAFENEEIMGVAQLKFHEMDIYPEKEHWLGGVYVPVEHCGKGIATQLIRQALRIARSLGIPALFLQTENLDGGLYTNLGWVPVDQAKNCGVDVLVMEKILMKGEPGWASSIGER